MEREKRIVGGIKQFGQREELNLMKYLIRNVPPSSPLLPSAAYLSFVNKRPASVYTPPRVHNFALTLVIGRVHTPSPPPP